jgi:hypothetical protein
MRFLSRTLLAGFCLGFAVTASAKTSFPFAGSTVELLDSAEAAAGNGRSDAYTRALTPFDLSMRLGKPSGLTEQDYLREAAEAVSSWPESEVVQLKAAFDALAKAVQAHGLKLHLPATIQMIKTSGNEEFGAEGYTRGTRIMLNTEAQPLGMHLVAHELFHVISRNNASLQDRAYAVFGFRRINKIDFSKAADGQAITNPDCPTIEHAIALGDAGATKDYALLLYSRLPFTENANLGEIAAIGLLQLTGSEGVKKAATTSSGEPIVLELSDVPGLFKKIGSNTQYVLHPEEISAEHFAMLVSEEQVQEPAYLAKMEKALQQ